MANRETKAVGEDPRWWNKDTVAVVTGANKGIGFEIARALAKQGITTVLTARDEDRGKKAVEALKREGLDNVIFHPLDVQSEESSRNLAQWLSQNYGGIDVLMNNAGVAKKDVNVENADLVLGTNYYGVKQVTDALMPLLRNSTHDARIVVTGSRAGELKGLQNNNFEEELADREHITEAKTDAFVSNYKNGVKNGTWQDGGFPARNTNYSVSKIAVNGYVGALANELSSRPEGQRIQVNSFCPGYTQTDMTDSKGNNTPEQGADTGVWLALQPPGAPSGKFWGERHELAF